MRTFLCFNYTELCMFQTRLPASCVQCSDRQKGKSDTATAIYHQTSEALVRQTSLLNLITKHHPVWQETLESDRQNEDLTEGVDQRTCELRYSVAVWGHLDQYE